MTDRPSDLKPCPFCGHTPQDWRDFLHPTGGGWRDDAGQRHYIRRDDPRGTHGEVWELGCLEHEGGCGATMYGDSRAEVLAKWNARATPSSPPEPNDDRILWGVVANAGRLSRKRQPRWSHVCEATGLGSTVATALCRRFGFDPDEQRAPELAKEWK